MNPTLCELLDKGGITTCFLSDEFGNPLDPFSTESLICEEVKEGKGRKNVPVTLPDGQEVQLQKVIIRKSGFIVVKVSDGLNTCLSEPISFCKIENVLLCAPEGTEILCKVSDFQCFACINCQGGFYNSLEVFLDICQDIQVSTDVTVELTSDFCEPRDIIDVSCKRNVSIPPQCDLGFGSQSSAEDLPIVRKVEGNSIKDNTYFEENICINTKKVYDWIVQQTNIEIRKNSDDAPFVCDICRIDQFVPSNIICEDEITGSVVCDSTPVVGASVFFTSSNDIVTFSPNPAITEPDGTFFTTVTVPEGTDLSEVTITTTTNANGQTVSDTMPTMVSCPEEECSIVLFGSSAIECSGVVSGNITCGNEPIQGVEVTFTAAPDIINFDPNPATTGADGNFFSGVIVPDGTPPTEVEIIASTNVDGELLSDTIITEVSCDQDCELTIDVPNEITCEGDITGTIFCDDLPVEDAEITFSIFPAIGTFTPNPALSAGDGTFTTNLIIPVNTPPTSVMITATTTINGSTVTTMAGTTVDCPGEECPCKFRIGVEGNAAPAEVVITENGSSDTLNGTINITAVECFTASPMCNPAVDNFNVTFSSNGTTINFIQGRRIEIECEGNSFARVRGTAMAQGNLLSGIFEVEITLAIDNMNIGTWSVFATNFEGETFSTTFLAEVNPMTFIGDCDDTTVN
ncbi:BMQ_0737 family morphogenetic spore coat protein [Gracilibacillus massiliensis]|uniref:hypothetical protein n=1 Tax=Gracilibacillus massiliensis TaxID=1564956 RepID=UPI000A5DEA11|nr:hypothetical protein [Gracilibacillus massiliensis]